MYFRAQLTPNKPYYVTPAGGLSLTNALKLSGKKASVSFSVDGQTFPLVEVLGNKVEYQLAMNIAKADIITFESVGDAHVSIYGHVKTRSCLTCCNMNRNMTYEMDRAQLLAQLDDKRN